MDEETLSYGFTWICLRHACANMLAANIRSGRQGERSEMVAWSGPRPSAIVRCEKTPRRRFVYGGSSSIAVLISRQLGVIMVQESAGKELADGGCDLCSVGLECEMTSVQKADDPIGDVPFERLRARR
jgi:hypothetical protein